MPIPGWQDAHIAEDKVTRYLLNPDHPDGASKARVLGHAGFGVSQPEVLIQALREQHATLEPHEGNSSPFGQKYEVTAPLVGPSGTVVVTSVWMVRHGESFPRLITVVPEPKP